MSQNRVQKGVSTGGQFATEGKSEDTDVTLESAKKWGLIVSPGASLEVAHDLSQAGLTGSLSPENDPDGNLHDGTHPQSRYTTSGGRNFTISKAPDGTHEVADADNRDDDGYVRVEGDASHEIAESVRGIVRDRLAWDHAPSEALSSYGDETVEFRTSDIEVRDGQAYVSAVLSDDEGEYYRVEFDPANQSITASHDHEAEGQLKDEALLERLNLQVNLEMLNDYLETVRFDEDCDPELYDAIGNAMSHEPS